VNTHPLPPLSLLPFQFSPKMFSSKKYKVSQTLSSLSYINILKKITGFYPNVLISWYITVRIRG